MNLLPALPFWAQLLVFAGSAVVIWVAGISLSNYTDILAERLHLGQALGGLILLAVATNLPEIAITYSAAASDHLDVAVSNILGGIALQTVVLVALDAFGVRERRPLTYQAASLTLVIEGAVVLAVLAVVVMGTQLPKTLVYARLTPDVVMIAAVWVAGLLLTQRAGKALRWSNSGEAPDSQPKPRGHSQKTRAADATRRGVSTTRAALVFTSAAAATLVAGALAEESGTAAANHVGLSGVLFGATVLAAATSLPELSTGLTSVKQGDYKLAFGDIFGGNAFLPVLFLLAVVVSGKAVLPNAHASDIYLTGLGGLLTIVYMAASASTASPSWPSTRSESSASLLCPTELNAVCTQPTRLSRPAARGGIALRPLHGDDDHETSFTPERTPSSTGMRLPAAAAPRGTPARRLVGKRWDWAILVVAVHDGNGGAYGRVALCSGSDDV